MSPEVALSFDQGSAHRHRSCETTRSLMARARKTTVNRTVFKLAKTVAKRPQPAPAEPGVPGRTGRHDGAVLPMPVRAGGVRSGPQRGRAPAQQPLPHWQGRPAHAEGSAAASPGARGQARPPMPRRARPRHGAPPAWRCAHWAGPSHGQAGLPQCRPPAGGTRLPAPA